MPSNEGEDHGNIMMDDEDLEEEEDDEDLEDDDDDDDDDDNVTVHHPHLQHHQEQTFPPPTIVIQPDRPTTTTPTPVLQEEKKPSAAFDDTRRLFQRLWTDEDEILLLQGFLDYTSQRGGFKNSAYHHDTGPFYDQIKSKLQLNFNKNQLVEKLRRLKKKYRNVMTRITSGRDVSFKTPHDQAAFEISRKIWCGIDGVAEDDDEHGNGSNPHNININITPPVGDATNNGPHFKLPPSSSRKRSRSRAATPIIPTPMPMLLPPPPPAVVAKEENISYPYPYPLNLLSSPVNSSVPNVIEDTVKSCLSPLLKELMVSAINGPGNGRGFGGVLFEGNSSLNLLSGAGEKEAMDDKWKTQQILELEVLSKRVELVQEQIKMALEELRSSGGQ